MKRRFQRLWQFRSFIVTSVVSDFRLRFARSRLGGAWLMLHPLMQVAIYALVLSNLLSAKLPGIDNPYAYAIYLTAGMLGWTLFSELLSRTMTMFTDNAHLMKKILFPIAALPLIVTATALINAFVLLMAILLVFFLLGHYPSPMILWIVPLFGVTVLLAVGIGGILATLNVFVRDISQVTPVFLQALFWFTPIVYMPSIIPEAYRHYLAYNPLNPLIQGFQNVLAFDIPPDGALLALTAATGTAAVVLAVFLYRRAAAEMVDVL